MKKDVDVLLIDDDKDICTMVEAILKFAGYNVQTCVQPDQVFTILTVTHPRLILMDMLLSGSDGRDVCRKIKADQSNSAIKIIMMSAHPDADKSCRDAGADDFVPKPFDLDYFIGRVKKQLEAVS